MRARLDPTTDRTASLAAAISAWRETRAIQSEVQLITLAGNIQSREETRSLSASLDLSNLVSAVQSYRAEAAVAHALEQIRLASLQPDPLIMAGLDLYLNGRDVLEGQTWKIERTGDHTKVTEQVTGKTAYEVRSGRVLCDDGAKELADRIEQVRAEAQAIYANAKNSAPKTNLARGRSR